MLQVINLKALYSLYLPVYIFILDNLSINCLLRNLLHLIIGNNIACINHCLSLAENEVYISGPHVLIENRELRISCNLTDFDQSRDEAPRWYTLEWDSNLELLY